ncbi:uncharacterized protein IL334_004135 [Kwoniella shivajii]|uniref:Uncharacterized protein n=1 Tax=Kwoniella shivajii TaxID=564305 RepID=A0ABZ1D0U7_9TREE|nr:hypothetical protein IL334_004135 [Kwoniella shivajii]
MSKLQLSGVSPKQTSPSPTSMTSPHFLHPNLPDPSSSSLRRNTSRSSQHEVSIPSPRPPMPNSSRSSFKVVSRHNSVKSKAGHGKEVSNQSQHSEDGVKSPMSESSSVEVVRLGEDLGAQIALDEGEDIGLGISQRGPYYLLGSTNRTRSRSIGENDSPGENHGQQNTPRSSKSHNPATRDITPMNSPLPPPAGMSRRISSLGTTVQTGDSSPYPQGTSPVVSTHTSPESGDENSNRTPSVTSIHSAAGRSYSVQQRPSNHLVPPAPSVMVPLADDSPRLARPTASTSSLDKIKSGSDLSPKVSLRRQGSGDAEDLNRQRPRSHSNASSISSKLARLLRTGSQRSRRPPDKELLAASDVEESGIAPSAASSSPADVLGRISLDEPPRLPSETFESGSYSSQRGFAPSPERGMWNWDSRLRSGPMRRNSNLSEEYTRPIDRALDEEEVDWNGPISDDDDYDESSSSSRPIPPSAPNFTPSWRRNSRDTLGLDIQLPTAQPVAVTPSLDPIPDGSPLSNLSVPPRPAPISISSTDSMQCTPSRASSRLSQSPYRSTFAGDRAKSPLGVPEDSPRRLALSRQTSASILDDDEDEGLAISIGSRRGRKGSMLGRRADD